MNRKPCADCNTPTANADAFSRSISLKNVRVCRSCATARGWEPLIPAPRQPERVQADFL